MTSISARPRIFVSAVSAELKSARDTVAKTLVSIGFEPVWQETFGFDPGELPENHVAKIRSCMGLIQITGAAYGFEPPKEHPIHGRCSYTQLEYFYAKVLGKPVWVLLPDDKFSRDSPLEELDLPQEETVDSPERYRLERRELQKNYVSRLKEDEQLYHPFSGFDGLKLRIHQLKDELKSLRERAERWQLRIQRATMIAAGVVLLPLFLSGAQLLPWDRPVLAVLLLGWIFALLALTWRIGTTPSRKIGGEVQTARTSGRGRIRIPIQAAILLAALAPILWFSISPFFPLEKRLYIASSHGNILSLTLGSHRSHNEVVSNEATLLFAHHPVHRLLAGFAERFRSGQTIVLRSTNSGDRLMTTLPLHEEIVSSWTDLTGTDFSVYRITLSTVPSWGMHLNLHRGGETAPEEYGLDARLIYESADLVNTFAHVNRADTIQWENVVLGDSRRKELRYAVLLTEFLNGHLDPEAADWMQELWVSAPDDRERLRVLLFSVLIEGRKWRGNILQTQLIPKLKHCENLLSIQLANSPNLTDDQFLFWALATLKEQFEKCGPVFEEPIADYERLLPDLLSTNTPFLLPLESLGTVRFRNFLDSIPGGEKFQAALDDTKGQVDLRHFGNPTGEDPERTLMRAAFTLLASKGVPETLDHLTKTDPTYSEIWWESILQWWTEDLYFTLIQLTPLLKTLDAKEPDQDLILHLAELLERTSRELQTLNRWQNELFPKGAPDVPAASGIFTLLLDAFGTKIEPPWPRPNTEAPEKPADVGDLVVSSPWIGDAAALISALAKEKSSRSDPAERFAAAVFSPSIPRPVRWIYHAVKSIGTASEAEIIRRVFADELAMFITEDWIIEPEIKARWQKILLNPSIHHAIKFALSSGIAKKFSELLSLDNDAEIFAVLGQPNDSLPGGAARSLYTAVIEITALLSEIENHQAFDPILFPERRRQLRRWAVKNSVRLDAIPLGRDLPRLLAETEEFLGQSDPGWTNTSTGFLATAFGDPAVKGLSNSTGKPGFLSPRDRIMRRAIIVGLASQDFTDGSLDDPRLQAMKKSAPLLHGLVEAASATHATPLEKWAIELGRSQSLDSMELSYPLTAECLLYSLIEPLDLFDSGGLEKNAELVRLPQKIFAAVAGISPRAYLESVVDPSPPRESALLNSQTLPLTP